MHETIDDEVIVIDLASGSYYSLRATGAEIWRGVERGLTEDEIAELVGARYEASPGEIGAGVSELLRELSAEGLIESANGAGEPLPVELSLRANDDRPRERFQPPVLEKHTDMQDLILLDPVHEVDARGWPHAQVDAP